MRTDLHASPSVATNWRPSFAAGGSPGNPDTSPPTITAIAPQTIAEDADTGDLAFTIGDLETRSTP